MAKNKKALHLWLIRIKKVYFSWKKLAGFVYYFYICTCVFHSIRFKVNKVMGHGGDPFFISTPFKGIKNAAFRAALLIYRVPSLPFCDIWNLISFF